MLIIICLVIVLVIVIILSGLEYNRRKLLFCPNTKIAWVPGDNQNLYLKRNKESKVVTCVKGERGSINLWDFVMAPHGTEGAGPNRIVIFCHGTNGNISQRRYIYNFCKLFNLNLILFDYFGYGESSGEPTEKNIYTSAKIAVDYCKERYTNEIILWGESLGGTVAAYLAKQYPCNCLILMSTFSSLDDALNYSDIRYINSKIVNLLKYVYDTLPTKELVQKIRCPVLIIHSREDKLISLDNAELIYLNCFEAIKKKLIIIKGSHVSPLFDLQQFKTFLNFCKIDYHELTDQQLDHIILYLKDMSRTCFIY